MFIIGVVKYDFFFCLKIFFSKVVTFLEILHNIYYTRKSNKNRERDKLTNQSQWESNHSKKFPSYEGFFYV